jgi:orotidine-5'-phosphate decarboxylase
MMRAAAEAAAKASKELAIPRPLVLGVTVLTSLDRRMLETEVGVSGTVEAHVLRLAERARAAGLDGCVASAQEIAPLRLGLGRSWVIVTPGIRPAERKDDQARTATPRAAVRAGADYLVVGRPITAAVDPVAAARAILEEIGRFDA